MVGVVAHSGGKRLIVGLTLIICAGAAGVVANRGGNSVAAPQHQAAPSASQPTPATAGWLAEYSIGTQITAAINGVAAEPHGDIGEPALAQAP